MRLWSGHHQSSMRKSYWVPISFLLCGGSGLMGCKKELAEPVTPSVRVFTNKMELTDDAVKAKFLKRAPALFQQLPPVNSNDKIQFIKHNEAMFGSSTVKFSVVDDNSKYLFYSPRTMFVTNTDRWLNNLLKYTAPQYPVSISAGTYVYITQEVRVGHRAGPRIQLAYLQYFGSRTSVVNGVVVASSQATGLIFNELEERGIATVSSSDTIAVRAGSIGFEVR